MTYEVKLIYFEEKKAHIIPSFYIYFKGGAMNPRNNL